MAKLCISICLLTILHLSVLSQPFKLLKDINKGNPSCLGYPREPLNLTEANGRLFFTIYRVSDGNAGLWKTDGTAAGTVRVKEVESIVSMINVNGTLFFTTEGPSELWRSDGTESGTVLLQNTSASNLINVNGVLYFSTDDGLWKSDGTASGTILVKPLAGIQNLTNVNGTLFFASSAALWKSDGSEAGTVIVSDKFNQYSYITNFLSANGALYFTAAYWNIGAFELWKSDGTDTGTSMIKYIDTGATFNSTNKLIVSNGIVYFFANTSTNGTALWRTDGSEPGTTVVKELNESSYPQELFAYNDNLYFSANDDVAGMELWRSDGTEAGTRMLKDLYPGYSGNYPNGSGPGGFFNVNGTLYFTAENSVRPEGVYACGDFTGELWKSDGTEGGTVLVKDIYKGGAGSGPSSLTNVNGSLFFVATDGLYGRELWKSDGTSAGTSMIKDLFATGGSDPKDFVLVNGVPYFVARDPRGGPAYQFGEDLYKTDGTVSNTIQFSDISPISQTLPRNLTSFNGQVFFLANDNMSRALWKSDGTSRGTVKVKNILVSTPIPNQDGNQSKFCVVNQTMFFSASDGITGVELWKTDGTEVGTVLVKDINGNGDSNPKNMTNVNGVLYFVANNGSGYGLYRSDGTDAGTQLLSGFYNVSGNSPAYLTAINGVLYFTADDGLNGVELWKSDGTFSGTEMVKNINAGPANSSPSFLTNVNGVLFFAADDGIHGMELWKSDGTSTGTIMIKDVRSGNAGSNPSTITNLNGLTYFSADDGTSARELWRSNGTAAGTVMVQDIWPGPNGSNPTQLTRIGNNILFSANNGVAGSEIWSANNSSLGARMLGDIEPGPGSSNPTAFLEYGSKVLAAATNNMVGSEVWIADVPADIPTGLNATITAAGPLTICTGQSVQLQANTGSGYIYQWKKAGVNIAGAIQSNYTATLAGYYTVVVTDASGASATSDITIVTLANAPLATVAAAGPLTFCAGKNVLLKAITGTGYTYQWKKAGVNIENATLSSYTAIIAGTYSVVVSNATGCSTISSPINVTVNAVPLATVAVAGPLTFCQGKNVQLKAITGTGYTYQWKRGGADIAGAILSNYVATTTGIYTVIVTNAGGCSTTSAAFTVVVKPLPLATITPVGSTTFCSGKNVLLKANTGTSYTYHWIRGATAIPDAIQSTYAATTSGQYTVIVTNASGCSVTSAAIPVTVTPLPAALITPAGPLTFCAGQTVSLKANTGTNYTYQWKKAGVNIPDAILVNYTASASGVYSVVVTNAAGCSVTSPGVTVAVNSVPLATVVAAGATSFCAGKSVLLKAINGTGYTYQWRKNGIDIPQEITSNYTATATGVYSVVVTNATGCSTTSIGIGVTVTMAPLATVAVAGPLTFCEGKNVLLKAINGTGYTYQWKKNAVNIPAQTQSNYTATATGVYTVMVTSAEGCSTLSTGINVMVTPAPAAIITANGPLTFHQGGNVMLNASAAAGNTYQWKKDGINITGATSESYVATASGSYTVVVTNAGSCQATSQIIQVSVTSTRLLTKGLINEEESIKVYPNPLHENEYLNIESSLINAKNGLHITVFDISGRMIDSKILKTYVSKIRIKGASGVYVVEIRWGENKRKIFQIIKI